MDDATGASPERGVHAAALASLPRATPRRLEQLLRRQDPAKVWEKVQTGQMAKWVAGEDLHDIWRDHARGTDLAAIAAHLESLDAWVTTPASRQHPLAVIHDLDPAPILFRCGRLPDPTAPAVAIVGTRRCTPTGRSVAMELGSGLAAAGVTVVSGLALGIDGAAHRGALAADGAPVVGVVGSGLDVVYPRGNRDLWEAVSSVGTLLSEAPLGAEPEGWRFPARNRLLAALADVVVVVESKRAGGYSWFRFPKVLVSLSRSSRKTESRDVRVSRYGCLGSLCLFLPPWVSDTAKVSRWSRLFIAARPPVDHRLTGARLHAHSTDEPV